MSEKKRPARRLKPSGSAVRVDVRLFDARCRPRRCRLRTQTSAGRRTCRRCSRRARFRFRRATGPADPDPAFDERKAGAHVVVRVQRVVRVVAVEDDRDRGIERVAVRAARDGADASAGALTAATAARLLRRGGWAPAAAACVALSSCRARRARRSLRPAPAAACSRNFCASVSSARMRASSACNCGSVGVLAGATAANAGPAKRYADSQRQQRWSHHDSCVRVLAGWSPSAKI